MSSVCSEPIATSEAESEDEELLSPSDGFFSATAVPDEIHVPDPSQRNTQADKEREAREEQHQHQQQQQEQAASASASASANANAAAHPSWQAPLAPPSRTPGSLEDDLGVDERTSLISQAPPAYSDVGQDTNMNHELHRATGIMGHPSPFFTHQSPQNLGGAEEPLLNGSSQRKRPSWREYLTDGNKLGKLLLIICGALLSLAALIKLGTYLNDRLHHPVRTMPGAAHARPVPASCHGTIYRSKDERQFMDPRSFSLTQKRQDVDGDQHIQLTGLVLIQRAHGKDNVTVDIEYRTNLESLLEGVALKPNTHYAESAGALELWVPEFTDKNSNSWHRPCLDIDIAISVPDDAAFDEFHVSVETLDMLLENLAYSGAESKLETTTGSIHMDTSAHAYTRVIRVHSNTGSVEGTYPLLDLLDIQTRTGSVDVILSPQDADSKNLPAKLQIDSNTGSVGVQTDVSNLPTRDYQSDIHSGTSSIDVALMHGSITRLHGRTASVGGKLTPVGPLKEPSTVDVEVITGSITLAIAPHIHKPKKPLRLLNGQYQSHTGSIEITHPLQWEGTVHADTTTGSISVDWPGMTRDNSEEGGWFPGFKWPGSWFEGRKGKGDAVIEAHSGTGSVNLLGRDI